MNRLRQHPYESHRYTDASVIRLPVVVVVPTLVAQAIRLRRSESALHSDLST